MTRVPRVLPAVGVVATLLAVAACRTPPSSPAPPDATPGDGTVQVGGAAAAAAGIETAPARWVERRDPLRAAGVVGFDERRTSRLGALVEGVVDEIRVQPGDAVARGAVVARLHSHAVHDAWADYFKALAARQRADAELAFAETAAARAAALVEDRALSAQELARARADVTVAAQQVAAARAEITRTEQELHHYGITPRPDADPLQQEDSPVVAPLAGTVIERLVTTGTAVTPGTPLLVISDLTRVWISCEIDETLVGRVTPGQAVVVTAAAYPEASFAGTLTAIGDVVDARTRRVTLRVEAANPDRRLKPQMLVAVAIAAAAPRRVLVVPATAVQTMDGEAVVFVRTEGDRFVRRAVGLGPEADGLVEVVRGLAEGDLVATAGAFLLKSALAAPTTGEPD
ncbi:MAG: efflux RND transporter periplasmic adaptor subunit [Vicinamibacterales bacterium]